MPDYDYEISLWKNDEREKDTDPHYKGSAKVDGVEYWAVAWGRKKDGNPKAPLIKVRLNRKEERRGRDAPAEPADFDDDIPF